MNNSTRRLSADDYLRCAFWALCDDSEAELDQTQLLKLADDMEAMVQDAFEYWLLHGKAPLLAEPQEDE